MDLNIQFKTTYLPVQKIGYIRHQIPIKPLRRRLTHSHHQWRNDPVPQVPRLEELVSQQPLSIVPGSQAVGHPAVDERVAESECSGRELVVEGRIGRGVVDRPAPVGQPELEVVHSLFTEGDGEVFFVGDDLHLCSDYFSEIS